MFRPAVAALALAGIALAGAARADVRCTVPLGEWQPKDALEAKLKAEGWVAPTIRVDDGCYKVRATGPDGRRLKAKFNPATLERMSRSDDE